MSFSSGRQGRGTTGWEVQGEIGESRTSLPSVYLGRNRLTEKPIDLSGYGARRMRLVDVASFANAWQGVVRTVVLSNDKLVRIDGLGIASR